MNKKQETEAMAQEIRDNAEASADFKKVSNNLPPGQAKNLLKDEVIGPILEKYGVTGE